MIKQDETRQENWTKVDQNESDNYIKWLTITELNTF